MSVRGRFFSACLFSRIHLLLLLLSSAPMIHFGCMRHGFGFIIDCLIPGMSFFFTSVSSTSMIHGSVPFSLAFCLILSVSLSSLTNARVGFALRRVCLASESAETRRDKTRQHHSRDRCSTCLSK